MKIVTLSILYTLSPFAYHLFPPFSAISFPVGSIVSIPFSTPFSYFLLQLHIRFLIETFLIVPFLPRFRFLFVTSVASHDALTTPG